MLLNASIRWCGSFRINPTVSVRRICCLPGRSSALVVGSSVANNWFSSRTPACVIVLSSVDFPALVYPTIAATFTRLLSRWLRISSLCFCTCSSCSFSWPIRLWISRRSISSFFSPGPRVPMPPPRRDSEARIPTSLAARYFNCASSTWIFPSLVFARCAKMSRITMVLSITLHSSSCSRLFSCAGESSSSQITPVASKSYNNSFSSSSFPFPR